MRRASSPRSVARIACVLAGFLALAVLALPQGSPQAPNTLSDREKAEGWRLLFDGTSLSGWRGIGRPDVPKAHWTIEDGAIKKIKSGDVPLQKDGQPLAGGDLMTVETFGDFELSFEWRISPAGNSGVKYNVSEELSRAIPPGTAALGFEYQVLDDDLHADAKNGPNRTAGALYDLIGPDPAARKLRPVGAYNTARIVFIGNHGEHWLNGAKVLEYDLETPRFAGLVAKSKYRAIAGFAERRKGHIVLQDHTDAVWYRNIKIRNLR